MAEFYYDQDNFTAGELDPKTAARVSWEGYYKGVAKMRDAIVIPQGGFDSRWGTNTVISTPNADPTQYEFSTLTYEDNAVYMMVWAPTQLLIYLSNILLANITTTYKAQDIGGLRFSEVDNSAVITNMNSSYQMAQLVRGANTPNLIANVDTVNNYIIVTTADTIGNIYPVQFTTTTTLPATIPQININETYFVKFITTTACQVFSTQDDATNGVNAYTIINVGTGTNNLVVFNTWTIANIPITVFPTFDFLSGSYQDTRTFTPSATSGNPVTITASVNTFTADMVGGIFNGNGGSLRIVGVTSPTIITGFTITGFINTNAIVGQEAYLASPAWSATNGWPKVSAFLQNRIFFAGSRSIQNGVWGSAINGISNFDDSESLADNAISWYPNNGGSSFIKALSSERALMIHKETITESSPVNTEAPLTPTSFSIIKKNEYGVADLQPVFIDNQLYFVDSSGTNVISMIWEITQSTFVTTNKSVGSSGLIRQPRDMASFSQSDFTDGFYVFFVNSDGTLCVHQTLHEDGISSWSLSSTQQTFYGGPGVTYTVPNQYYHVITAKKNCWFSVMRQILTPATPANITGVNAGLDYITAPGHGMTVGQVYYVRFTNTPTLPTTTPQININAFYFAVAFDANNFVLYQYLTDAQQAINEITIIAYNGAGSTVVPNSMVPTLQVEQLDFTKFMDGTQTKTGVPRNTITGLQLFEGESVQVIGDGYWLGSVTVVNGQIPIPRASSNVIVGRQFIPTVVPLPIAIPGQPGTKYRPKHIRNVYINYYNMVYAQINGSQIPTGTEQVNYTSVAQPTSGIYEYTPMGGFDNQYAVTITQPAPFPMTILGLSYIVEI